MPFLSRCVRFQTPRVQLRTLCREITDNGWYFISDQYAISMDSFVRYYRTGLGMEYFDDLREVRRRQDANGYQHIRYQQFHKGLPVYGTYFDLHGLAQSIARGTWHPPAAAF